MGVLVKVARGVTILLALIGIRHIVMIAWFVKHWWRHNMKATL